MMFAINITDGLSLSNKTRHEFMLKKTEQGNAVLAIHFTVKEI